MPVAIEGDGKVERIIVERTELDEQLRSRGTGERYSIDCSLVVSCIGYTTPPVERSEEHTSELQSLMRISYAVFCLKKKKHTVKIHRYINDSKQYNTQKTKN